MAPPMRAGKSSMVSKPMAVQFNVLVISREALPPEPSPASVPSFDLRPILYLP